MRPAWDGIAGWLLVLAALLVLVVWGDATVNGADALGVALFGAGLVLLLGVLHRE